jgi:hypothetical protein
MPLWSHWPASSCRRIFARRQRPRCLRANGWTHAETPAFPSWIVLAAALLTSLAIGWPAVARAAYDAANAHRVDGKHAVGAGASPARRAGKLVATNSNGRLPNNIIGRAPNSARVGGLEPEQLRTQWLSVTRLGTVYGGSPAATAVTVTHPATGTYCVSVAGIIRASVSGTVQSDLNGFEDLTMTVTSLYNTSACPGEIRIYTARSGVLYDTPFTLTFSMD